MTDKTLSLELQASDEELVGILREATSGRDVAKLLDVGYGALTYWAVRKNLSDRYEEFTIPKRNGGHRTIKAPLPPLKVIQRKLARILALLYSPRDVVLGFVPGGGVVRNARSHVGKRFVLNVDLRHFFDAIHFGRVRGLLMAAPYSLPKAVATILAQLTCSSPGLPQGGPTSPIVSNMVCARLDSELYRLARKYHCSYTRYADDLTLSSNRSTFPADLAVREGGGTAVGSHLSAVIESNGFEVNASKVRLQTSSDRQEVTGIVVNEKLNVRRSYIRETRAMLHAWEEQGLDVASETHAGLYAKRRHPKRMAPRFELVVRGRVGFIGMVRGFDDGLYLRLRNKLVELSPDDSWKDLRSPRGRLKEAVRVVEVPGVAQGTGFQLRGVGFVTCAHVLGDGSDIVVYDSESPESSVPATVVVRDDDADLAVLKLEEPPEWELVGNMDWQAEEGLPVTVAGFPVQRPGDTLYAQEGQVTQIRARPQRRFLVSAAIVGGNSGGPVLAGDAVVGVAAHGADGWEETDPRKQDEAFGVIPITRLKSMLSTGGSSESSL